MANTRKPAKGPASKGAKTVEDAVVVDEKGAVKAPVADDKGAKSAEKSGKKPASGRPGKQSDKQAESTSKAVASEKELDAKPLKKTTQPETGSDKPDPKEDAVAIKKPKTPASPPVAKADASRRGALS